MATWARAQTTWQGPPAGDWFTAGNWSNGVPSSGSGLDALIPAGSVILTTDSSVIAARSIALSGGTVPTPTFLAIATTVFVSSGSVVVGRDAGSHAFILLGAPHSHFIGAYPDFQSTGLVTLGAAGVGEFSVTTGNQAIFGGLVMGDSAGSSGTLRIDGATTWIISASQIANSGSAAVIITNGGTFDAAGRDVTVGGGGGLATLNVSGSTSTFHTGTLSIGSASTFSVSDDGNFRVDSGIMAGSSHWEVTDSGTVQFFGNITTESSTWDIGPGGRVGSDNTTFFDSATEITFTLDGSADPGRWITGALNFDGHLTLVLDGAFTPEEGDSFDLFDFSFLSGAFDTVALPTLAPGLAWDTSQLYLTGVVSVVPEPGTVALFAIGGLAMLVRRRRS